MMSRERPWPPGNSQMAVRTREFDWAATSLGPIEQWTERFRALVELMLDSPEMVSILWGPDAIQLYNDAYAAGIGDRHPAALGRAAATTWADAVDVFGPLIDRAWAGESVTERNVPIAFTQDAPRDVGWFDLTYTPLRDDRGDIGGIYAVVTETSDRLHTEQTLRSSEERYRSLFESIDEGYALYELLFDPAGQPVDVLILEVNPAYESLMERPDSHGKTLREIDQTVDQEWIDAMASVAATGTPARFERYNAKLGRWFDVYVAPAPGDNVNRILLVFSEITGRMLATEALRLSEERYRMLFDSIDEGYALYEPIFDAAGDMTDVRIIEVNPAYLRLTHRPDPRGKTLNEVSTGLDPMWADAMTQVIRSEQPARFVRHNRDIDRWFEVFISLVSTRPSPRIVLILNDITERSRSETALRESESRFRTLIQNLPDYAIFLLDADGIITEWSDGAARVTGFASEEVLGHHLSLLYPEDVGSAGDPEHELAEAASAGRIEHEGWHVRKHGARFWGHEIVTAIRDQHGALLGFTKISRDLTEQRRRVEALKASEERVRTIVEQTIDYGIFTIDVDGRIEDWFRGAQEVFGWDAGEAVGMAFADTFTPEDRAAGVPEQELQEARLHGAAPDVRWHQRKDGSRVFIEGTTRARYGLDGEFLGAMKIGRNATEQRLAEQRRIEQDEQTQRELRHQVAVATAELRALSRRLLVVQEEERRYLARELHDEIGQMLTGLSFTLSTASTSQEQFAEAQRIVAELSRQIRQLSTDLRPPALDAYGLLPSLRSHVERYELQTGIMVDLRADGMDQRFPAPIEITTYRIVQEALTNVARHSQASEVLVQLVADEQTLTISIRDAGLGFDTARLLGATGLGGMRERAELVGGTFDIDTSPGAGVRITAELPLTDALLQHPTGTEDPGAPS